MGEEGSVRTDWLRIGWPSCQAELRHCDHAGFRPGMTYFLEFLQLVVLYTIGYLLPKQDEGAYQI